MPDEQTVEDFNAREKHRASIVARLHGYTPWETGDTEEALKAEYEALTGEAYRSREEEQAANLEAAKERRQQRIETQLDSDRQIIAEAKANGFQDCLAIRNALGWDKPAPNGSYYNAMQVAYRWIVDAGEEVVYLIPDGSTDVPKGNRTGCYPGRLRPRAGLQERVLRQAEARRLDASTWRSSRKPGRWKAQRRTSWTGTRLSWRWGPSRPRPMPP